MKRNLSIVLLVLISLVSVGLLPTFAQEPYAEIPASAFDPSVDLSNGYYVGDLGDGAYYLTEGTYQLMFLTTGEGVIIVDAPPSLAPFIFEGVASVTDEPITHVVYSHSHADHIAGAGVLPEDAIYIAHEDTASQLADGGLTGLTGIPFGTFTGGAPVPMPTVTFSDSYTLEVGNQVLELDYRGIIHEPGNIFIYAPQQKVLMLVDIIFPGWSPFSQLALAEDVPLYYQAHEEVLSYDFDVFLGGHLTRIGTREDVEIQQAYMVDILTNVITALQTTDLNAIVAEVGVPNAWAIFDVYLATVAQTCADATIPNWVDTLGGVDVFTYSHCYTVMNSVRID